MAGESRGKQGGWERRDFLKLLGGMGGAAVLPTLPLQAASKEIYPAGDISFICYSQPGGGFDTMAKGSAPFLTKALREVSRGARGGNIQVKNMTGGAGAKAAYYIFNDARPDGYTIGDLNRGSFYKFMLTADKLPFDLRNFTYLYSPSNSNRILVSGKRSGINSWEALLTKSKKEPVTFAVSTVGGSEHLDTIYVKESTGIPSQLTKWGSTSQSEAALIRGDVDVALASYDSMRTLIDAKEVNFLISFTKERLVPTVPTIVEKGFPKVANWVGGPGRGMVIAPPNLDPEVKRIIVAAARKMMTDPGFLSFCEKTGTDLEPLFDKELEEYVKGIIKFYTEMAPTYKKYGL